jgi:hypothetical protein
MVFCVLTVVAMGAATWRYGNSIHHHRMEAMQAWDRFNGAQQPAAVIRSEEPRGSGREGLPKPPTIWYYHLVM